MRFTIPLVLLTFVVTTAASLYARNGVDDTNIFNRAVSRHDARQLPASIPADCQKYCTPVSNATRTKCPQSECCKTDFATEYYKCFLCVGNATKETDWSGPQQTYNSYVQSCAVSGYTVPHFTFSTTTTTSAASNTTSTATSSSSVNTETTSVKNSAVDWKSRNDYIPWMISLMAALAGLNLG